MSQIYLDTTKVQKHMSRKVLPDSFDDKDSFQVVYTIPSKHSRSMLSRDPFLK